MWKVKFRGKQASALRLVFIYLVFGGLWIFFSDRILLGLAPDVENYLLLQTYKGWLFVFCTALLLYLLSVHEFHVRDRVTEDLASSVLEKDELMRELHHRVKNNLQLIMSLMNLQRNNKEIDLLSRDILQQLYMRVHSIAVFHEKVYRLELYSKIPLADYIREIVDSAYYEYSETLSRIRLELELEDREVTVEKALPLGIIVNELLLNCITHAFSEEPPDDAVIRIMLVGEGSYDKLLVEDNGQGYAENVEHEEGLGYTLIHSLLKQIDGELEVQHTAGTRVVLRVSTKSRTPTHQEEELVAL
ncbi:MAG: sensor histidine kinase [Spirochaetia bacterium]